MSVGTPPHEILSAGCEQAHLTLEQLWLAYLAFGGLHSPAEVRALLDGDGTLTAQEYDLLAHAINERFMDDGLDHPIPYAKELGL